MNILKKTVILFCLAAIPLSTVQPTYAALRKGSKENHNNRTRRKKSAKIDNVTKAGILLIGLLVGGGLFFWKKNSSTNKPVDSQLKQVPPKNIYKKQETKNPLSQLPFEKGEIIIINTFDTGLTYLLDGKERRMLKFSDYFKKVMISPTGDYIFGVKSYNQLFIFDSKMGFKKFTPQNGIKNIAFDPKDNNKFIACNKGNMYLYTIITDKLERKDLYTFNDNIKMLCFSPDGKYIIIITHNLFSPQKEEPKTERHGIFIYDKKEEEIRYEGEQENIQNIAWHPKENYVALTYSDGKLRIYKIPKSEDEDATLELVCENKHIYDRYKQKVTSVSWSPNGKNIALTTDEYIFIATLNGNKEITEVKEMYDNATITISDATWSGDGKVIFLDTTFGRICICENPLNVGEKSILKFKPEIGETLDSLTLGYVKDTSKWDEWKKTIKLTEIKEDD